jgi:hypothetical protein
MTAAVSYAVWALLGAVLLALWARSHSTGSTLARPAAVVERLATGPVLRVALVAWWMFTGWHFFAR